MIFDLILLLLPILTVVLVIRHRRYVEDRYEMIKELEHNIATMLKEIIEKEGD